MAHGDHRPSGTKAGTIMARLKAETSHRHQKLEALPYFQALGEHRLPLECYVHQLRALAVIHGVFESEMAAATDARLATVWQDGLRKLPWLEKDLTFFAPRVLADDNASLEAALVMTENIRRRKAEAPYTLLGYLYVMEGSTLGNSMHRPDIAKTFHLETAGCRYYAAYQENVHEHWYQFSDTVNGALEDPAFHDGVIEAAHEAFVGLEALYTALYPLGKRTQAFHVARINPEAGRHPIPADEREIQAALKASDRTWSVFPYYAKRYGERGKRFSDSDTCWLATLTALDQEALQKQIDWLCRVLAARGMPSLMMEQALRFLHAELVSALPDKLTAHAKLCHAADTLKAARERWIPEMALQALAEEFDRAVRPETAAEYPNTGQLLASAAVDERNGKDGAVDALLTWLADDKRFSKDWVRAVLATVQEARRIASS